VKFQKNPNAIGDLIFNEELILRELFNEFEDRYHMLKNIERLNSK
jgi:Fe-S cluster biosynthesis and repair protein YggX